MTNWFKQLARVVLPKNVENARLGSSEDEKLLNQYNTLKLPNHQELRGAYDSGRLNQEDFINNASIRSQYDKLIAEKEYRDEKNKNDALIALNIGTAAIPSGSIASGGLNTLKVGKATLQGFKSGAVGGAIGGGIYGFGEGLIDPNKNIVQNAVSNAATNAALGEVGGAVLKGGVTKIARNARIKEVDALLDKRSDWGIAYQKASGNPDLAIKPY